MLLYRPYKDTLQTLSAICSETCMSFLSLSLLYYSFSASVPSALEDWAQGSVYLSLVLGNVLAGVGTICTAIEVIRRYQEIQKVKPIWTLNLGFNSNRPIKQS